MDGEEEIGKEEQTIESDKAKASCCVPELRVKKGEVSTREFCG